MYGGRLYFYPGKEGSPFRYYLPIPKILCNHTLTTGLFICALLICFVCVCVCVCLCVITKSFLFRVNSVCIAASPYVLPVGMFYLASSDYHTPLCTQGSHYSLLWNAMFKHSIMHFSTWSLYAMLSNERSTKIKGANSSVFEFLNFITI
jgi:hypothetical protein